MNFVIAVANDWQGIYLNGELLIQNHSISATQLLRYINGYRANFGPRIITEVKYVDEDWLQVIGVLPQLLDEVKFV